MWILKALHSLWSAYFEGKSATDAMILVANWARLLVPLFSHSTGFSSGSHWFNQIRTGDLLNEFGTVGCTRWKTQVGVPKLKEHRHT